MEKELSPLKTRDSDDSDDEDFFTYQDDSFAVTALGNVNGIVDRLYRLSFKIRNPATRIGFTKARNYQEVDESTGVDLIRILAAFNLQHVEQVFLRLQRDLQSEDVKEHFLVKRLARANTRRRQQFKQWKSHRTKIEANSKHAQKFNLLIPSSKVPKEGAIQTLKATRIITQPAPSMPSTATRVDPAIANFDDAASVISSSTHAIFTRKPSLALEIPQLPRKLRLQKDFECPYCHRLCSGRTSNPQTWNHHVLRDLRPYICTYEECKDGDQQYDSFKERINHETHHHRITRRCGEHLGESFLSLNEWREHIASYHLDSTGVNDVDITEFDSVPSEKERSCPICAEEALSHEHVGYHLQQLALFALPRSTGLEEDSAPGDNASAATADDLERGQLNDSDMSSLSDDERWPPEAVYGVHFNDVGNMLADLDPFQLAHDHRHIDDGWHVIYNPKLPRMLDIELRYSFSRNSVICCVTFSIDGQFVAIGYKQHATIYEVETGSETATFRVGDDLDDGTMYVRGLSFDSGKLYLAIGSEDKLIRVFHTESRKLQITLVGHGSYVSAVTFVPNSYLLLSGSKDGTARLWDYQTGVEKVKSFTAESVNAVATSPNGRLLAAGCLDSTARIWNLEGELLVTLSGHEGHNDGIFNLNFSPEGRSVATSSLDKTCKIWDLDTKTVLGKGAEIKQTLVGHKNFVLTSKFTHDGRWILICSKDQGIQIWDPVTYDAVLRTDGHEESVISLDTSPTDNYFASASGDKTMKIWRLVASPPLEG
ncbi:MAG: hypothetical protein Q9170_004915 [Blastenia crenularia]